MFVYCSTYNLVSILHKCKKKKIPAPAVLPKAGQNI